MQRRAGAGLLRKERKKMSYESALERLGISHLKDDPQAVHDYCQAILDEQEQESQARKQQNQPQK